VTSAVLAQNAPAKKKQGERLRGGSDAR
jgi:hypothetical protein